MKPTGFLYFFSSILSPFCYFSSPFLLLFPLPPSFLRTFPHILLSFFIPHVLKISAKVVSSKELFIEIRIVKN